VLKLLTIKYVKCKCIRSYVGDPKDWENQTTEIIRDTDGYPIMKVYRDYCVCPVCQEKGVTNG